MLLAWDVFPMRMDLSDLGLVLMLCFSCCWHDFISCILPVVVGETHGFHMIWFGDDGVSWV